MTSNQTLGNLIKMARKAKNYSQRELAKQIGLDFTYLSKIENNKVDYPPREEVIRTLASNLDLNSEELIFLAGRIPQKDSELLKRHYQTRPALFRQMRKDSQFAERLSQEMSDKN